MPVTWEILVGLPYTQVQIRIAFGYVTALSGLSMVKI